jgi:hypothetical protein
MLHLSSILRSLWTSVGSCDNNPYLKSMQGKLLMIICEKIICNYYFSSLYYLTWSCSLGPWTFSLFEGFNRIIHWYMDIWSICVNFYSRCLTCVEIPYLSNMVSELVWGPTAIVDRDLEPMSFHVAKDL